MHVSICITTWNDVSRLPDLFASIRAQSWKEYSVRLFDNGSADGETVPYILREEPHWLAARSTKFIGRAAAQNHLIRLALDRHVEHVADHAILIVESETTWHPDMLERLVRALEENPSWDAVQPKMYRAFSERGDLNGDAVHSDILDSTGGVLNGLTLRNRGAGEMDRGQFDQDQHDILPTFGVVLIRACALIDLSVEGEVFDETFSFGEIETDFALRFARLDYHAHCVSAAVAYRYRGASVETSHRVSAAVRKHLPETQRARFHMVNAWMLRVKYASLLSIIVWGCIGMIFDLPRVIFSLHDGMFRRVVYFMIKRLPFFVRSRKVVQEKGVYSLADAQRMYRGT